MVKTKDPHRLRLILEASKIEQCIWCGTQQSDNWFHSGDATYCSVECMKSSSSQDRKVLSIMMILTLATFVMMYLTTSSVLGSDLTARVVAYAVFFPLIIVLLILSVNQFRKYAQVPKGSRTDVHPTVVSLVRKISAPVECPNCDATIDLTNIGDDMVYHCQYCGAEGVVEIDIQDEPV